MFSSEGKVMSGCRGKGGSGKEGKGWRWLWREEMGLETVV